MKMDYAMEEPNKGELTLWWVLHIVARAFMINSAIFFGLYTYLTLGWSEISLRYQYLDVAGMWCLIIGIGIYFCMLISCLKFKDR